MLPVWRVTRTAPARRLYDALGRLGITATSMIYYEADLAAVSAPSRKRDARSPSIERIDPSANDLTPSDLDPWRSAEVGARDWVIEARDGQVAVGRVIVSDEAEHYVDPLETRVPVSGAYVRRMFVTPEWRGRGVGSLLLGQAVSFAKEELAVDRASAMVAVDNRPSRGLFEKYGFRPVGRYQYVRLGPLRWRPFTGTDSE